MRRYAPASYAAAAVLLVGANLLLVAAGANVHFSWAIAPDVESPPATYAPLSGRLVVIEIDGLRRDQAFENGLMPNLERLRSEGAGGAMLTSEIVMTGLCVRTMWTGVSPDILAILKNWDTTTSDADNFYRQADRANMTIALLGDDSLTNQFGAWADFVHGEKDGGISNINASDFRTWELGEPLVGNRTYDIVNLHFAGLDHAGHTYMLDSPQYRTKVRYMDWIINQTASMLDPAKDTLAVLIDHAQTDAGYHGFGGMEPRDVAYVLWGRGVKVGANASIEQKDVASTMCALMGLPMPSAGEGTPRVELLDAAPRWRAAVSLYAAKLRARYIAEYSSHTGTDLTTAAGTVREAEAANASGDWNTVVQASRRAITEMNNEYYASLSPGTASLAPAVVAAVLAIACASLSVWMPPGYKSLAVLGLGALILFAGIAELALGTVRKDVVQSPIWRWGVGTAFLALALSALAFAVSAGSSKEVSKATATHPFASSLWLFGALAIEFAVLAFYSSALDFFYDKPFALKLGLGMAVAVAVAAVSAIASMRIRRLAPDRRGPLLALSLAFLVLILSCLFVKHLVVAAVAAAAVGGVCLAWMALARGRAKAAPEASGAGVRKPAGWSRYLPAVIGFPFLLLLLAYSLVKVGAVVWGGSDFIELDFYPRYLTPFSALGAVLLIALFAWHARLNIVRSFGGVPGMALAGTALALAVAFQYIGESHVTALDWTARVALLASALGIGVSLTNRDREPLLLLNVSAMYILLATPGQSLVFLTLLASCAFLLRSSLRFAGAGATGHLVRGIAVVGLSYASFMALGYGFNFTSVDIRASTIGLTELYLPWAVLIIAVKYTLPMLLILWAFTDTAEEALGAAMAASCFMALRSVQICIVLFTNIEQFTLLVPFTGEMLHVLMFMPAVLIFGAMLYAQRRPGLDPLAQAPVRAIPSPME